jgi:hypothetical protein
MPDTDTEMLDDDLDPEDMDPAAEELAKLEEEDDDDLDAFGEPTKDKDDDDQFGRLRH